MKRHFIVRLTAAALALILHVMVVVGLAISPAAETGPAPDTRSTILQVSLGSPHRAAVDALLLATPNAMPEREHVQPAVENNVDTRGDVTPNNGLLNSVLTPGWEDWLASLSNTPLPLQEYLPLNSQPEYFPASELQLRPSPEAPVILPFPDAPLGKQKATAILLLYISAEGTVDRVEIDESELPAEFEKVAIDTFLQAKMRPGIKDGSAVPARMKIEVEFEAK